jgi:geranylgeranyl diphosphate synthase type II
MSASARIERALEAALAGTQSPGAPKLLASATSWAVFPRGARLRPRLTLAVAAACGEDRPGLVDAAAAAIELIHCASLVHDDLPCFDAADMRRGKASVHKAFGERIAVLAGDGLIVLAFQTLAAAPPPSAAAPQILAAAHQPSAAASQTFAAALGDAPARTGGAGRLGTLVTVLARAVGMPGGIAAGQAWECEPVADVATYHRQKTGALFAGAAMLGAAACGVDPEPWRLLGETLGEAYQAADDIGDAASDEGSLGKPVGRDRALGRPSLVTEFGLGGALRRFDDLVAAAVAAVPACAGAGDLETLIVTESRRLLPKGFAERQAA